MNNEDDRPNPDQLLSLLKNDSDKKNHGKLKVFLGMVAGVGKTYAMLQAAQMLKRQNVDVLVGWVETHDRKDTVEALQGLKILPRLSSDHRGVEIEEMDLDQVLKLKPKVVLVDELAHSNKPGSRHTKRYLDVIDILEDGIDVYTTLNVQHLESRIDTVREITGITISETVPDSFLDRADEVVLIDIPPEDLILRLNEGKIYPAERAQLAAKNFFRKGNLTALREIALRVSAERVDREVREFKVLHGIENVWKSGNRLLVAIFASPYSESLIRWTRRVADLLNATWVGAYVDTDKQLSEFEKNLLAKNISLVTQLGGEIIATRDEDTVAGLLRIARQNNVTQIIVGKSRKGTLSNLLAGGSIVSRLLRQSGEIDIYASASSRMEINNPGKKTKLVNENFSYNEAGLLFVVLLVTCGIAALISPLIGYLAVGIVFLCSVSLAGIFLSRLSTMILAVLFALIHNYFFIPPVHTFSIQKPEDFMMLSMFFIAASLMGHLTSRLSQKEKILKLREQRTVALYGIARGIAAAQSLPDVIENTLSQLRKVLDLDVTILLKSKKLGNTLDAHTSGTYKPSEKDLVVASWAFMHGKIAGRFTDTLPGSEGVFFPIFGRSAEVLGVLGIDLNKKKPIEFDQNNLIETILFQISAGIEREKYHVQTRDIEIMEETQRLYQTLLDSVSHELKTPLSAIKGCASALVDPVTLVSPHTIQILGNEILQGSIRLQRLVENLLDMTRVESGMILPKKDICDVSDLIGTALRELYRPVDTHTFKMEIPKDLPPVICDPLLMDQVLGNIIHNALEYSPRGTAIEISAKELPQNYVSIMIRDHGPGISETHKVFIFQKFYRSTPEHTGGVGLGLSIAKGFMDLQGGSIEVANHVQGGAVFTIILPKG